MVIENNLTLFYAVLCVRSSYFPERLKISSIVVCKISSIVVCYQLDVVSRQR